MFSKSPSEKLDLIVGSFAIRYRKAKHENVHMSSPEVASGTNSVLENSFAFDVASIPNKIKMQSANSEFCRIDTTPSHLFVSERLQMLISVAGAGVNIFALKEIFLDISYRSPFSSRK